MKLDVLRQIKFRLASDLYPAALLSHVSKVIKRVAPLSRQPVQEKASGADAMVPAGSDIGTRGQEGEPGMQFISLSSFIVLGIIIFLCGVLTGCLFLLFLT